MIVTEPPHVLLASGLRSRKLARFRKRELSRFLALATEAAGLEGKVSVLLTDDETIRHLNRQFRKKDTATDVLSFPPGPLPASMPKRTERRLAGDLAISLPRAAQQADAFGHPLEVEVKILLLHGVLHLSGLDHETDSGEMARTESAMRKKLGLPIGLIARSAESPQSMKKKSRKKVSVEKRAAAVPRRGVQP